MTGRLPQREQHMYGGTSVNRNYQSTGRTLSNREGNLELYAHRKATGKAEAEAGKAERRTWNKETKEKGSLQRYNSTEAAKKVALESSLPPKEKTKRGLSILNRENNNFVRDVSERVKRAPLGRLKQIGLYQGKEGEYRFPDELPPEGAREEKSKTGELCDAEASKSGTFQSIRALNKSLKQAKETAKRTSIDREGGTEGGRKKKAETLKHLKRRNPRKKKRDLSTKKKEKEPRKREKGKKKAHQPSLSTKIERNPEPRAKRGEDSKRTKKKKGRKGLDSVAKSKKKRGAKAKAEDSKKLYVSGEVYLNSLYGEKEEPERSKKKKARKLKNGAKGKEGRRGKGGKAKKPKDSPKELTSGERKRYLSVNTGKNPLLEGDLAGTFNPRKTLNPKSISLKRGASFKSNDIQKTDLFSYKFQRDSLQRELKPPKGKAKSKARKKELLYSGSGPKTPTPALYQRNRSQASSDNDDTQGLYKNLYSGRHEKKLLEYNSTQSSLTRKRATGRAAQAAQRVWDAEVA